MSYGKDPITGRKPDPCQNPTGIDKLIQAQRRRERRLHPLRVDPRTVIYVTKDKCNPAYAERYLQRMRQGTPLARRGGKRTGEGIEF